MTITLRYAGIAIVIASALYARPASGGVSPVEEVEARLYECIDGLGFSEYEVKADLYSRLAEKLTSVTPFSEACELIDQCLVQTRKVYPRGF